MISETDYEFLQTVWSRRPFFTYIFFGINIVIFLLMTLARGTTNQATLIAFGVKSNALIDHGEYWRFITPIFIHIGLLHLFFNSYALWIVGPQVEKLYGGARFVLLYVMTGFAGVLGSYWYRPEGLSAGASGAIFGLFGVLLVFGLRYRHNIPPFFRRAVGTGVLPVIVINLIIGLTIPAIDNSAHISGLLAGMAMAAVVPFERPGTRTPTLFVGIQWMLIACIVGSFVAVATHYDGPRLALQNVSRGWSGLIGIESRDTDFPDAVNAFQQAFEESQRALTSGSRGEVTRSIAEVGRALDQLKNIPSMSPKADDMASQMLKLTEDQYELLKDADRTGTLTIMQGRRAAENEKRYQELKDFFYQWVEAEGERYGIQLRKPH